MHHYPPQTLKATPAIDSDHPTIAAFATQYARGDTPREQAQSLYLAVRDGLRYDPYRINLSEHGMKASTTLALGHGWCVPKAVLLAAVARAAGIPARLGFADVLNHLSTERLRQTMQTDVFVWHGCTELWLGDALAQVDTGVQPLAVRKVWAAAAGIRWRARFALSPV